MSNLDDTDDQSPSSYTGLSLSTTGELTVLVLVMTFLLFVIILIFYFRARRYMGVTNASQASLEPRRHRRLMIAPNQTANSLHRPLDPSVLKSLPVAAFRREEEEGGLDCAVCLSEFTEGEEARLLPKCKHRFHVECIDMWFRSNSTCPLCRLPVGPTPVIAKPSPRVPLRKDSPASITRSFDKGSTSSTTTSSSSGMVAIDIPIE